MKTLESILPNKVDKQKFRKHMKNSKFEKNVVIDDEIVKTLNITHTPSVYLNNRYLENPFDINVINEIIGE